MSVDRTQPRSGAPRTPETTTAASLNQGPTSPGGAPSNSSAPASDRFAATPVEGRTAAPSTDKVLDQLTETRQNRSRRASAAVSGPSTGRPLSEFQNDFEPHLGEVLRATVPFHGLDYVSRMLQDAGGKDGTISRAEVQKLAEKLRSEGKGNEASAAEQVYAMIDTYDSAPRATVTKEDFNRAYPLFKLWFNRGGEGTALGQELVSLGRMEQARQLEGGPNPRPIPREVADKAVDYVSKMLKEAAGKDGVLSRADAGRLVADLTAKGRATEAVAADQLYRFIDAREPASGARITSSDIDKGAKYVRDTLLRKKDSNRDGYQPAEIQKMSTTARALLETGRLMADGAIPGVDTGKPGQKAEMLSLQFDALAKDLTFMSETDAPYKPFSATLDPKQPFTPETFLKAIGAPAGTPVRVESVDEYFDRMRSEDTGYDEATVAKFKALQDAMNAGLTEPKLMYLQGEEVIQAPVYLVGRTKDGDLAGLESMRVWT